MTDLVYGPDETPRSARDNRAHCEGHFDCVNADPDAFAKGARKAGLLGGRGELEGL